MTDDDSLRTSFPPAAGEPAAPLKRSRGRRFWIALAQIALILIFLIVTFVMWLPAIVVRKP